MNGGKLFPNMELLGLEFRKQDVWDVKDFAIQGVLCNLTTSSFTSSELVAIMKAMGNKKHHQIWESRKPRSKPSSSSNREEREDFIRAKYISKEFLFVLPLSSKDPAEVLCNVM